MPAPLTAFSTALARSDLHTALLHLQHHGLLDAHLTPSNTTALSDASHQHATARLSLYRALVPLLLLPSAASHTRSLRPLRATVAQLLAQLRLPPNLRFAAPPPHIPPHLREDASIALAQTASELACALIDAWNTMAPPRFAVEDAARLPDAIRNVRQERDLQRAETRDLDVAIADTRRVAVEMYVCAMSAALDATETDLEERYRPANADVARVDMLVARGKATTAKLKLQRAEIAAMVYTEDAVAALKKVAAEVERRLEKVERRIEEGERKLREYRAGGERMLSVVEEYVRAKEKLDEKIWSRDALKR